MQIQTVARVLRPLASLALGMGVSLGSAYIKSRIQDRQETDARLERMEKMLETLQELDEKE